MSDPRSCSFDPCRCDGLPQLAIGTPEYAVGRYHEDAGDLAALRQMNNWLAARRPFTHIRFADGEFDAILGKYVTNIEQDRHSAGLGAALHAILLAAREWEGEREFLFGGDWSGDSDRLAYLERYDLLLNIPWCPSQVFVNGIPSDTTMRFLEFVRAWPRRPYLVCNESVARVAPALRAITITVPSHNAWDSAERISRSLHGLIVPGDLVLYAAGQSAKVLAWNTMLACPASTNIDVGCLFDGAVGLISRAWLENDDARSVRFREVYAPFLVGSPNA